MAIIGSILGDIAGSQYEFYHPDDLDWKNCELFTEKCVFTDDTVMSLAIKSAVDNGLDYQSEILRIGRKYPDCGYGGKFERWMFSENPRPYGSYGNGSAMRVSYLADYYDDLDILKQETAKATLLSHNTDEGVKGAITIVTCIWMAKHEKTKDEIYDYVLEMYPSNQYEYSSMPIKELEYKYVEDVTCMTGVPAAARCFYESDSYVSFLRNIFRFENDADTFGAMFGGVAEEYYGKTGLKDRKILEHYLDSFLLNILDGGDSGHEAI